MSAFGGMLFVGGFIALVVSVVGVFKPMFFKTRERAAIGSVVAVASSIAGGTMIESGGPEDPSYIVRQWGDIPATEALEGVPQMAIVCVGLHYGLISQKDRGENDPLFPADLRDTCARSVPKLTGACRRYAQAASHLGAVAVDYKEGTPERIAAERAAQKEFRPCVPKAA